MILCFYQYIYLRTKMPNVLITTQCNKKCPYCFAKEKVEIGIKKKAAVDKEISLENLNIIIDFFKKSGVNQFSLIGGEPTIHSKILEIINILISHDFVVHIFTNGLWSSKLVELIKNIPSNKLTFLININSPDITPKEEWDLINKNLKAIAGRENVTLGINIYKENFDYEYLVNLCIKYGFKRIRWSLTNPIYGKNNNQFVPLESAHKYAQRIVDFTDICGKNNIFTDNDCSIPLCMFTEEQIGKMVINGVNGLTDNSCAEGPIDIGTDLSIWKCFAFSEFTHHKLTDFKNIEQIHKYFKTIFHPQEKKLSSMDKCVDCSIKKRSLCSGGCLAHSIIKNGFSL